MAENENTYGSFRWFILTALAVSQGGAFMNISSFSPLLLHISEDMHVSMSSAVSFMSSIFFASAVAFIFIGGQLIDRIGVKSTLILGVATTGAAAAFVPLVHTSYNIVFVLRLIQGGAMAVTFVCQAPALHAYFPKKEYGICGGLMGGALSLGASITMLFTPIIFQSVHSWPTTVALMSIPAWLGVFLMFFVPKAATAEESKNASDRKDQIGYFEVFKYPVTWFGIGTMFFSVWSLRALESLAPTYLSAPAPLGVGLGDIVGGRFTSSMTMAGLLGVIVGGLLLDKVAHGNYRIVMMLGLAIFAVSAFLITLPVVYGSYTLLMVFLVLAGFGVPFVKACGGAFTIAVYPPRLIGRIFGLMVGLGSFGASAGIWVGGEIAEKTGRFSSAMLTLALAGVGGFILSCFLKPELTLRRREAKTVSSRDVPAAIE